MATDPIMETRQKIDMNQSHMRCDREGFNSLERRFTTASFGRT